MKSLSTSPLLTLALSLVAAACGDPAGDEAPELAEAAARLALEDDATAGEPGEGLLDADEAGTLADELAEALPEPAHPPEVACDFKALRQRALAIFDLDDDGELSRAELSLLRRELRDLRTERPRLVAFMRHRRALVHHRVLLVAFDSNDDGALDEAERAELVERMEARCEARRARALERWDANGDGALSAEERAAARAELVAELEAAWDAVLAAYDADGSGTLDPAEHRARVRDRRAEVRARIEARRARIDTDGDGRLSAEERAAHRAEVRARFAESDG